MASSACAKCGNGTFELKEQAPRGSGYKMNLVQCSSCGTPIGAMDYFPVGTNVHQLIEQVKALEANMERRFAHVEQGVATRLLKP